MKVLSILIRHNLHVIYVNFLNMFWCLYFGFTNDTNKK